MKIHDLIAESTEASGFLKMLKDFLPHVMQELKIDVLPKIKLETNINDKAQPTFGRFANYENTIYLAIENRHPNDVCRTLAHELVHFRQFMNNELNPNSGETGSPAENEANSIAGIIMRNFNKKHPEYFKLSPIDLQ